MRARIFVFTLLVVILAGAANALVQQEWVARYNGPGNNIDQASKLTVDGYGNVYVTGSSYGGSGSVMDYATIKYNSTGVQQWAARYNGPGNGDDGASSLAVDGNGNVYVTGYSYGFGTNYDYATIKYDSAGALLWAARYNGPGNYSDEATSIAVDGNGNVYVTGYSYGNGTGTDYATIKYNAVGVQQWVARYNGPGNGADVATSIAVDNQGNVYVTGASAQFSTSPGNYDYATIEYNSIGQQQWVARYNGPGNGDDEAYRLGLDNLGNEFVTGYSWGSLTGPDYATIKYNAAGQQQWVARYDGVNGGGDMATCLSVDGESNVYVTGYSDGRGGVPDYATLKYNTAGQQQWVARYNGPGNGDDDASSLAVDHSGNVYVTGESYGGTGTYDYATIKYDASGNQLWVARYNDPWNGDDRATNLVLDGNGNVYVTGSSTGSGTNYDYATIKYHQWPDLVVSLAPLSPPVIIPANGGSFQFYASVLNNGPAQISFTVWARDRYPNGTYTANLLGPVQINPPVGVAVTRQRTQNVPASWPAGLHYYIAYAGLTASYPAIDADSFSWTKSAARDGGATLWNASCSGEPFPGEELASGDIHPSSFILYPSVPNPFNPSTDIRYQIPDARNVSLRVYDTSGRLVATLADGQQQAGTHQVTFDGTRLPSGIYLAKLQVGDFRAVQKLVLLK